MLAVGRGVFRFGAVPCPCQHPQSGKPEGYELIKKKHNRRGKTEGRNQIKGSGGLAREESTFSSSLAETFGKNEDKTKCGGE